MRITTNAAGLAALFCFLTSAPSWAQAASEPPVQVFAGYAYLHAEPLAHQFTGSDDHGWNTSVMANVNSWLTVVGDVAGRYGSTITTGPVVGPPAFKGTTRPYMYSYLLGPQVTYRSNRFAPFAHALFGLARERTGMNEVDFVSPQTDNGFATKLGGGLDLAVTPHLAVRAVEADYFRASVFNQSQNSFGLSFGIVLGFGKHSATGGLQGSQ
jgi:outer membrane protein with beta-barrel domain